MEQEQLSEEQEMLKARCQAFNEGCDARFAGNPLTECPYHDDDFSRRWVEGWKDMDKHWCDWNKYRKLMNPLPTVKK